MSVVSDDQASTQRRRLRHRGRNPASAGGMRRWLHPLTSRWNEADPFDYPPRDTWPVGLRRARIVGLVVLLVQLLVLCWWSSVLVHRYAITVDFAAYNQAAYLIAHGHLNPYSTVLSQQFWRNDSEFIIWPLALLVRIWPHLTTLAWLQDIALVAAEAVALGWICDIAARRAQRDGTPRLAAALVALGVLLLVGNPWVVWTVSFDVHLEPFSVLFMLLTARDLYRGRRRGWLWVVPAIACGSVGASYLAAFGISAALTGRRWWKQGAGLAGLGVFWLVFLQAIHGASASGAIEYARLATGNSSTGFRPGLSIGTIVKQALMHPNRVLDALSSNKVNIWANLSPAGLIGLLWLPLMIPAIAITLEGGLSTVLFSRPGFQSVALGPIVAIGTVAMLAAFPVRSSSRRRWLLCTAIGLLMVNAAIWAIVWLPHASDTWLIVSKPASTTLKDLSREIRPADEVIVNQGVMGAFSNRAEIYPLAPNTKTLPIRARRVWIVITPDEGIESDQAHGFYSEIGRLDRNPAMHLVMASHGVWAYEWTPAAGTRSLRIGSGPAHGATEPAWTLAGEAGTVVDKGPNTNWYATGTDTAGYVIDQAYWRKPAGDYRASVSLSVAGNVNVELWNDSTDTLLTRRVVRDTHGRTTISMPVSLRTAPPEKEITGWGIWRATPLEPNGDNLEIRVWSPGAGTQVRVYSVRLQ